jgi:hypothetical protein
MKPKDPHETTPRYPAPGELERPVDSGLPSEGGGRRAWTPPTCRRLTARTGTGTTVGFNTDGSGSIVWS